MSHQESEGALVGYEDKAEQIDIKREITWGAYLRQEINFMAKNSDLCKRIQFSCLRYYTCLFTLSLISGKNQLNGNREVESLHCGDKMVYTLCLQNFLT